MMTEIDRVMDDAIRAAVAAEREACAKIVDCYHARCNGGERCRERADLAAAIRVRGQEGK
jgi:hypothetical protein